MGSSLNAHFSADATSGSGLTSRSVPSASPIGQAGALEAAYFSGRGSDPNLNSDLRHPNDPVESRIDRPKKSSPVEPFEDFSVSGSAHRLNLPEESDVTLAREPICNVRLTPEWARNVALIGSGRYSEALAVQLLRQGHNVAIWGRNPQRIAELTQAYSYFDGEQTAGTFFASTNPHEVVADRGILIGAVRASAFTDPELFPNYRPDPDTLFITAAKGLAFEGWDPAKNPDELVDGPPASATVYTTLGYLQTLPYWEDVKQMAMIAGPGFAKDIVAGSRFSLAAAANSEEARARLRGLFGHNRDESLAENVIVETTHDVPSVEASGIMKNVVAFACGLAWQLYVKEIETEHPTLGKIIEQHGLSEYEIVKNQGMREVHAFAQFLTDGPKVKNRSLQLPSGHADVNLSASNMGRNFLAGREIAQSYLDTVSNGGVWNRDTVKEIMWDLHRRGQTVEGIPSAWGVKIAAGEYIDLPLVHAVVNVLRGNVSPHEVLSVFFTNEFRAQRELLSFQGKSFRRWNEVQNSDTVAPDTMIGRG